MDRPESGLIKWSPNAAHDSFLHINLQHRVVQLYEPTGFAQRGRFEYRKLAKHDDLPPLTTYDWSPSVPGLVAVGTSTGVVNLLRIDDNSNAYLELGLKISRTCQAVAFNTAGRLAVALDRVRSDTCLHIWDVSRLSGPDAAAVSGFPADVDLPPDPVDRLELNASVSSVRFFEDNPNVLVAGIKGQGLRIHDLRDQGHGPVAQFQTKCCNNLAIDYANQNYFASSALDQPGVMVWDRRAIGRHAVSPYYADALEQDGLPWGGALRLDRAVQIETDPAAADSKSSFIRALRFCRDHAGMLAVLSRTGQLKVISTRREHFEADVKVDGSPELLEVRRSYEMDPLYAEPNRAHDKIVSFDWITMGSPVPQPRLLVLRASGAFDVLQKPSFTAEYPFHMVPWRGPHRGHADGSDYREALDFEPSQARDIFGPLLTERALSNVPLFGPHKANIKTVVADVLSDAHTGERLVTDVSQEGPLCASFDAASSIADKLKALRLAAKGGKEQPGEALLSQLELREKMLTDTRDMVGLSPKERYAVDHVMLLRALEGYRFDFEKNQRIVADDPWLRDVWAWVAGAEAAAAHGGMMSHPLDIGYMGVYTIWTNDLGTKPHARLLDDASPPDEVGWERCLNAICKNLGVPKFDGGAGTKRPHHREMCLEICGLGRAYDAEFQEALSASSPRRESTWYTMIAAQALFRGDKQGAVQVLKKASADHPELLFVSLALQLIGKTTDIEAKTALDFDEKVACKTDPYLRAISAIIATGDWAVIAAQRSLPLRDRCFVAVRYLDDDALTGWLEQEVSAIIETGDIEGIVLTGITDPLVDVLARYVQKHGDVQTAALLLSICAPRFVDDLRVNAMRNAYRQYLQRHRAFFFRAKFDVESTLRSKHNGRATVPPAPRQIGLRCIYCDLEFKAETLPPAPPPSRGGGGGGGTTASLPSFTARARQQQANPFTEKSVAAGISCPACKQHLPRCVVCLEVVGQPRSSSSGGSGGRGPGGGGGSGGNGSNGGSTARFPTFCLACGHVLHLDHARQWFARHRECPVPECRCLCGTRLNEELVY
ncbi:5105ba13-88cc-4f89-ab2e-de0fe568026f [Thermothielavioides terrestris]|uniref:5105ba13-88cc-4f89-ab2e-de0fe568026f n=1 Tax=Thermothielavioides terrestris TaxID=2587410 RepID=A0A446BIQ5_9PEZI|nr:5105ba13-88cc-4f89-ab2e-de0fe568026f [Thermothielavioides terrestris]